MTNYSLRGFALDNGDVGSAGGEVVNGTGKVKVFWYQHDPERLGDPTLLATMSWQDARSLAATLSEAAEDAQRMEAAE